MGRCDEFYAVNFWIVDCGWLAGRGLDANGKPAFVIDMGEGHMRVVNKYVWRGRFSREGAWRTLH